MMSIIKSNDYRGYSEIVRNGEGLVEYVDNRTGEVIPAVQQVMPLGSKVRTPASVERGRQYGNRQQERQSRSTQSHFYFASTKDRRGMIKPETVARMFFLASFLGYGDNHLYLTERGAALRKADLADVLNISTAQFYRFWREVEGKYLTEESDRAVKVIGGDFFRDALRRNKSKGTSYHRVFIEAIRELYRQTDTNQHKSLGRLFMLLPWISREWNVLCTNPEETDLDKIEYLTLPDFCRLVGWNQTQTSRVLEAFRTLTFTWDGKQQYVVAYLCDRVSRIERLIVNPAIIYRGSHADDVRSMALFFDTDQLDIRENGKSSDNTA